MEKKSIQTVVYVFAVVFIMTLWVCNRQKGMDKESNATWEQTEKARIKKLNQVAMRLEFVLNEQDSLYQQQISKVGSTPLRKALLDERQAWNELIVPWTTWDNRFNYYQRDALFQPFAHGWLFFVVNLIDKRDSSLAVVSSILNGRQPEEPIGYTWEDGVDYDSIMHYELENQIFCQTSVLDSAKVTDNFLRAWERFTAARQQVKQHLPSCVRQVYANDTRRWYELAKTHLEGNLSFRAMDIEEIWHRPIGPYTELRPDSLGKYSNYSLTL